MSTIKTVLSLIFSLSLLAGCLPSGTVFNNGIRLDPNYLEDYQLVLETTRTSGGQALDILADGQRYHAAIIRDIGVETFVVKNEHDVYWGDVGTDFTVDMVRSGDSTPTSAVTRGTAEAFQEAIRKIAKRIKENH